MNTLEFLQEHGITFYDQNSGVKDKHISHNPNWVHTKCPICGGTKLWLGYNKSQDYFYCFNHGWSSKFTLFREWLPELNIGYELKQLDPVLPQVKVQGSGDKKFTPPSPRYSPKDKQLFSNYLSSRNINPEYAEQLWGVKALDFDSELRYKFCLYFPVKNREGKELSWLTRTVSKDATVRYQNAPKDRESVSIKTLLFGEHLLQRLDTIIVCEGVFDAMRLGVNAVATMGKGITRDQIARIAKYPKRVFCLDNEKDTQERARKYAEDMSALPGETSFVCLDGPDPATSSDSDIHALRRAIGLL